MSETERDVRLTTIAVVPSTVKVVDHTHCVLPARRIIRIVLQVKNAVTVILLVDGLHPAIAEHADKVAVA